MENQYEDLPAGSIVIEDDRILKMQKGKNDMPNSLKVIGDFGFHILARNADGYLIKLNNRLFIDSLDATASLVTFRRWIRPATFNGNGDDLELLMSTLSASISHLAVDSLIAIKNQVGKYEDKRVTMWIFKNHLYITHKNGTRLTKSELIPIPESGILALDDFYLAVDNSEVNPTLLPTYEDPGEYTLAEFLPKWLEQLKNPYILYMLLGWFIASMRLEQVNLLRKGNFFPFFVLTAQTETGKTALLANCIKVLSMKYVGENFAESVSLFVELKEFAQVSHLPIWRDEYKNEHHAKTKEGWLRSVYTRASSSRGRSDQSIQQYPTRATLLLSGEDITDDPALARRMIKLRLTAEDRISKTDYLTLTKYANEYFGKVLPLLIDADFDENVFNFIMNSDETQIPDDTMEKDELMCCAALGAVFGSAVGFAAVEVAQESKKKSDVITEKQVTIEQFFMDVMAMFREKRFFEKGPYGQKPQALEYFIPTRNGHMYIRTRSLFPIIRKWQPRNTYAWTDKALLAMMVERYGAVMEARRIDDVTERVCIFKHVDAIEDETGDLFEKIQQVQKQWLESQVDTDQQSTPQQSISQHEEARASEGQSAHDPDEVPFEF